MGHTVSFCEDSSRGDGRPQAHQQWYGIWMRIETPRKSMGKDQGKRHTGSSQVVGNAPTVRRPNAGTALSSGNRTLTLPINHGSEK
ncbi:hypothetical protein LINPERHAP1_LOCUS242 [Linum perenne]